VQNKNHFPKAHAHVGFFFSFLSALRALTKNPPPIGATRTFAAYRLEAKKKTVTRVCVASIFEVWNVLLHRSEGIPVQGLLGQAQATPRLICLGFLCQHAKHAKKQSSLPEKCSARGHAGKVKAQ
jgi:hypothetical protein